MASSTASTIEIPDGFRLHTENTSHILLSENDAFLNPVQEFNRDLSVACITVWSQELNRIKEERWKKAQANKSRRANKNSTEKGSEDMNVDENDTKSEQTESVTAKDSTESAVSGYRPYKFIILEALSASGLRSIRYAKEIPLVKYVIANDLLPSAVEAIRRNIAINGFEEFKKESISSRPNNTKQKISINEGDACTLMYSHREEKNQVDVVDLDPYGTAAPFIDAAIQSVNNGGLLCVTCTDLSVLATTNYPEKCFSNYGGVPVKAEYCHESALRLLLHTLSTSASRYGRFIEPLLSLSIDFYIRLFIRVQTSPIDVKKALPKNSIFYICQMCQSHYEQPLGRMITKTSASGNHTNYVFKTQAGPSVSDKCPECESTLHVAGPMWSGPLHDKNFVGKVLAHVEQNDANYNTSSRMRGMLTVAKEELDTIFFFTPGKVAGFFHCETPSLDDVASALLNAGHKVSRSHASAGSLKTDASRRQLHDIYRSWVKIHPVKMENISETSPARLLLAKEILEEANFARHPQTIGALETVRLVRYQENPTGWGPGKKASGMKPELKRKRSSEGLKEPPAKR